MSRAFARLRSASPLRAARLVGAAAASAAIVLRSGAPVPHAVTPSTSHLFPSGRRSARGRRLAAIAEETWRALRTAVRQSRRRGGRTSSSPTRPNSPMAGRRRCPTTRSSSRRRGRRRRSSSADTDDWLRLVFTHEFTHIVHLDRSEGWARVVRGVFGRMPIAFPESVSAGLADRRARDVRGERR